MQNIYVGLFKSQAFGFLPVEIYAINKKPTPVSMGGNIPALIPITIITTASRMSRTIANENNFSGTIIKCTLFFLSPQLAHSKNNLFSKVHFKIIPTGAGATVYSYWRTL